MPSNSRKDKWVRGLMGVVVLGMIASSVVLFVLVSRSSAALGEISAETEEMLGINEVRVAIDRADAIALDWSRGDGATAVFVAGIDSVDLRVVEGFSALMSHAAASQSLFSDEERVIVGLRNQALDYTALIRSLVTRDPDQAALAEYHEVARNQSLEMRTAISDFVATEMAHIGDMAATAERSGRGSKEAVPWVGGGLLGLIFLFSILLRRIRRAEISSIDARSRQDRALASASALLIDSKTRSGLRDALVCLLEVSRGIGCYVEQAVLGSDERMVLAEVGVFGSPRANAGRGPHVEAEILSHGSVVGWVGFVMSGQAGESEAETHLLSQVAPVIGAVWEREASYRRLEEVLKSKDTFLASVSHELRTPMTAVLGLASELADQTRRFDESETRELCEIIAEQTTEVSEMLEDLLVAARTEIGNVTIKTQAVDLAETVRRVLASPTAKLRPDQRGSTRGDGAMVVADGLRVRQVLRNLISNARRYGGRNVVIEFGANPEHGFVRVVDDGAPLAPDASKRMFEKFYTADAGGTSPGGVGLGLPISLTLSRLMGGDLSFYRVDGLNTFELTLPLAAEETWSVS